MVYPVNPGGNGLSPLLDIYRKAYRSTKLDLFAVCKTAEQHINFLMKMALTKVSLLPFSLILDKWRFEVFRGDITPDNYNNRWWQLRSVMLN